MAEKSDAEPIVICSDEGVPPAIEEHLRAFLARYPGRWRLDFNQRLAGGWWSVKASTEGFQQTLLLRPAEQNADGVIQQLREALRAARPHLFPAATPWDGRDRRARPRP